MNEAYRGYMNDTIFTTGAYLRPQKIVDTMGIEKWMWVITEFTDDSFKDGEVFNPSEVADSHQELCRNFTHEIIKGYNGAIK